MGGALVVRDVVYVIALYSAFDFSIIQVLLRQVFIWCDFYKIHILTGRLLDVFLALCLASGALRALSGLGGPAYFCIGGVFYPNPSFFAVLGMQPWLRRQVRFDISVPPGIADYWRLSGTL